MHDNAAIERLAERLGKLLGEDVCSIWLVVHQERGIHVAKSACMLATEVELTQDWSLWEKPTDSAMHLAS